jgi:hypothetical protein
MANFPDGSSSFRSTTSNFQHPRERNPSSFLNSLRHFLLILPVLPSIPTSPTNISFTSPRMILGTGISSSTSEHKIWKPPLQGRSSTYSHQAPHYLLIGDILYRRGVNTILPRCLTIDEADRVLNDFHNAHACGGHLSGMSTTQKIIQPRLFLAHIVSRLHPRYEMM